MSQYSNLAIISWIQSTAGVPIAFAALTAAAYQEIANVGPRSPASCNIQRCESPASWEHPEIGSSWMFQAYCGCPPLLQLVDEVQTAQAAVE
ncbi:unnamed protein product [Sphagnum tenellum]